MFKYVFWLIVIYFAIRFIFNFLLPVLRTARQMKSQVREFQSRMDQQGAGASAHTQRRAGGHSQPFEGKQRFEGKAQDAAKPRSEDYIDFEEVK